MDIKPLPQVPVLPSTVDKSARNAFIDAYNRINQLIQSLGTVAKTTLTHAATHKTGGSDALTAADIGAAVVLDALPPGTTFLFAGDTCPDGALIRNGQNVSRAEYAKLFATIGTKYGVGDGSTTFTLPDDRGEFERCADLGRGIDVDRAIGSLQADEFKSHRHTIFGTGSTGTGASAGSVVVNTSSTQDRLSGYIGGTETRPRNRAYLPCIKY